MLVSTLAERIFLTSSSSAELCGPGISGLLLLLILDWRSILPTVAAVARPIVLYRLSAEGTAPPVPDHMFIDTKGKKKQRKFLILETLRANMFTGTTKQKKMMKHLHSACLEGDRAGETPSTGRLPRGCSYPAGP